MELAKQHGDIYDDTVDILPLLPILVYLYWK